MRPQLANPNVGVRPVELRFVHSPYADYLFYLLYRDTSRASGLGVVPLDSVSTLNVLVALPEIVASRRVKSYREILPLVDLYRGVTTRIVSTPSPRILTYGSEPVRYDSLRAIVTAGETAFPTFADAWRRQMEPEELRNIAIWRAQDAACHPMDSLQVLTRLLFPSPTLDVASIYMHLSGSGNYTPMGVYSRTFDKPNLAFTLGHEAMHLLVNPMTGHDWRKYPAAARTLAIGRAAGLNGDDLDELLALFMQVKLPQACGTTPATKRISDAFRSDSVRHEVLVTLEESWSEYRVSRQRWPTIIDYFLERTAEALLLHSGGTPATIHTNSSSVRVSAWAKYLAGKWDCRGAFASGRALAADVEFALDLGGRWLRYTHSDRPPGQYQAFAMWGPLPSVSASLTTTLYDNGGGQRRFLTSGWRDQEIVWTRDSTDVNPRSERFTYRRMADTTFWFAWEVQRTRPADAGWIVGDSLTCQRKDIR